MGKQIAKIGKFSHEKVYAVYADLKFSSFESNKKMITSAPLYNEQGNYIGYARKIKKYK